MRTVLYLYYDDMKDENRKAILLCSYLVGRWNMASSDKRNSSFSSFVSKENNHFFTNLPTTYISHLIGIFTKDDYIFMQIKALDCESRGSEQILDVVFLAFFDVYIFSGERKTYDICDTFDFRVCCCYF